MKRLALIALFMLCACHIPAHLNATPELFVRLSVSPQVCSRADETAEVYVYATRRFMPPGDVRFTIPGVLDVVLYANDTATLHLERVGLGAHIVDISSDGLSAQTSFTVWKCS